jgi:hypothetical protein
MTIRRSILGSLVGLTALTAALVAPTAALATSPSTALSPSAATTPTSPTAVCDDGHWPATVQGVPTLWHAGAAAGDYLWHDAAGWHLRVTHRGTGRVVFAGRITSSAPLTAAPVRLETGDVFALSADRLTLTYRFVNHGRIDGLNFRTACARRITIGGSMNGSRLPVGRIWIGRSNLHPLENPFSITRVP